MTALVLSIIVGVLTGVVANLATSLFVNVWLPAYRNYVYRGMRVQGNWSEENAEMAADGKSISPVWRLAARLVQRAYTISGSAVATKAEDQKVVDIIQYEVTGYIRDRFVILFMSGKDLGRIAHSTFHLEVVGDGTLMRGYRTFYGMRMNKIRAVECSWRRRDTPAVDERQTQLLTARLPIGNTKTQDLQSDSTLS